MASACFTLSVLTVLLSLAASQAFLALASLLYAVHLLRLPPSTAMGRAHAWSFPPIRAPLALFCFFSLVSVLWAANPAAGWFAIRKLVLFLIWLLALNLIVTLGHLRMLFHGLFLESALAGLVAAGQFAAQYRHVRTLHPDRIYSYMTVERVHGFMGHWMNFGGQQMLVFAVLLSFLLLGARPKKSWWLALAVVGGSIVLDFGRGVWAGCAVATVYLVWRRRARWLWALPCILALGFWAAPELVRQRVTSLRHPGHDPSLAIRFEMWDVALRMMAKHPLTGVGPNSIEQVYTLYLPPGKTPVVGYREHLHNDFLQLGAERGLPCLAAWVWLMAALGWHFVKIRRRIGREHEALWIVDGAIAAWLAFVVEGFFEFNFGTSPVLMLFLFVTSTPFIVERIEQRAKEQSKMIH